LPASLAPRSSPVLARFLCEEEAFRQGGPAKPMGHALVRRGDRAPFVEHGVPRRVETSRAILTPLATVPCESRSLPRHQWPISQSQLEVVRPTPGKLVTFASGRHSAERRLIEEPGYQPSLAILRLPELSSEASAALHSAIRFRTAARFLASTPNSVKELVGE
jgi:hypothetical protein